MSELTSTNTVPMASRAGLKAWLLVLLLCFAGALNYLDRTMITTMRDAVSKQMPMSNAQFGLLTSVFLWVYGLFSPIAGFLADRFNRSRVIIASLFLWSLFTWLTAYVQTFEQMLLARALMGMSEACYYPAALALIADYHRGSTRSMATGIHEVGITVGASLGFLGGMIGEKYDWKMAFSSFGLVGIVYALLLLFTLKDAPDASTNRAKGSSSKPSLKAGLHHLFAEQSFVLLVAFWGLLGIVGWMVMGWLPVYYRENFGLSEGIAGVYATGYLYPASMAGVLVGGYLADRWSTVNPRARIFIPAIGLVVAAPGIFLASYTSVLPLTVVFFMVYSFARAFTDSNLMPILCMVADDRYRATGYGVLNMFSCIIGGFGLLAGGVLRDSTVSLGVVFQMASVLIVICAVILYSIRFKNKVESTADSRNQ